MSENEVCNVCHKPFEVLNTLRGEKYCNKCYKIMIANIDIDKLLDTGLTERQRVEYAYDKFQAVIDYCRNEFDFSVATMVGILEIVKLDLYKKENEDSDE